MWLSNTHLKQRCKISKPTLSYHDKTNVWIFAVNLTSVFHTSWLIWGIKWFRVKRRRIPVPWHCTFHTNQWYSVRSDCSLMRKSTSNLPMKLTVSLQLVCEAMFLVLKLSYLYYGRIAIYWEEAIFILRSLPLCVAIEIEMAICVNRASSRYFFKTEVPGKYFQRSQHWVWCCYQTNRLKCQ